LVLSVLVVLVALACAVASAKRLRLVFDAWSLDPRTLVALSVVREGEISASSLWPALRAELEVEPGATWERELLEALQAPASVRVALVNEQLAELDYRAKRWARVPRVCASISTSFGFLVATVLVAVGLMSIDDTSALMLQAFNAVAVGVAGTAFCIAAQLRSEATLRDRIAATDKLVARLARDVS
jgi:hypothetical protein